MINGRDSELHHSLNLAGFRALATAAGLLQLCRELKTAGILPAEAIDRVRDAMFKELIEGAAPSRRHDPAFRDHLRHRLEGLFSGVESLNDTPVVPSR
ncbi:hypothetical protein [Sphingomonas sp. R1]|uniref:hypothetical protein n=1 Tax=Sphingomonas sp. R1 TaxID=399176 RepID=UPI002224A4C9|nr:hypothetical protein [Sphingomonas sp. R1]UYY79640.1 hypothetical protein OIM94_19500 [Sphingomonas sp. R1]